MTTASRLRPPPASSPAHASSVPARASDLPAWSARRTRSFSPSRRCLGAAGALSLGLALGACGGGSASTTGSATSTASSGGGGSAEAGGGASSLMAGSGGASASGTGSGGAGTMTSGSGGAPDFSALITIEAGALPLVISAPHGGEAVVPGVPERTSPDAVTDLDYATYELATGIQSRLLARTGKKAYLVAALASRKYIDFNRAPAEAYEAAAAAPVYQAYHAALTSAVSAAKATSSAAALLLDVHGQSADVKVVFRGTRDGETASLSTLYAMPKGFITVLLGSGVKVSPASTMGAEDPDFNGGYIVATYGKKSSSGINAVQLEFGFDYRDPAATVASTAGEVADALIAHLEANGAL